MSLPQRRAQGALVHAAPTWARRCRYHPHDNIISDYDQIIDYVERTFAGGTTAAQAQTVPSLENLGTTPQPRPRLGLPTRNPPDTGRAQIPPLQDPQISEDPHLECWGCSLLPGTQSHRLGYRPSKEQA